MTPSSKQFAPRKPFAPTQQFAPKQQFVSRRPLAPQRPLVSDATPWNNRENVKSYVRRKPAAKNRTVHVAEYTRRKRKT